MFCMSPVEDASLLLAIVRRHLRSLRLSLDAAYPDEDWGFTAQQSVEKLLKAWVVIDDRRPAQGGGKHQPPLPPRRTSRWLAIATPADDGAGSEGAAVK